MKSRAALSKRLSDAIADRAVSVRELCEALGINPQDIMTASQLWERILDAYMEVRAA